MKTTANSQERTKSTVDCEQTHEGGCLAAPLYGPKGIKATPDGQKAPFFCLLR